MDSAAAGVDRDSNIVESGKDGHPTPTRGSLGGALVVPHRVALKDAEETAARAVVGEGWKSMQKAEMHATVFECALASSRRGLPSTTS